MFVLYRCLLRLYPGAYFNEYASEMTLVFCQAWDAVKDRGLREQAQFCLREIVGTISGAVRERLNPSLWSSFGRFGMNKQFRFPRTMIFMMLVILASLILAIERAHRFQLNQSAETDILAAWLAVLFVPAYLLVAIPGAIGFAVFFALKRSGVHRLANIHTRAPK
jgi:hypothetical protein